ncbi:efflux RND transporter permease subunit [Oligoflexus tunisiensis]|uniref:efflux RND transporter permease subunit n=1 Tax=Oligoflexus tunisiensis TaxID=708132 RepID=UPI000AA4F167|nr:efflux RND transporter permease subunit [Oligoflexus tunisiensis]
MIEKIIEFSARNKFFVLVLTAVALMAALWTLKRQPLDAIPDLSDTQVIIYSKWDRSPDIVEDQVTYPIVTALLGTPHVKTVRGISDFGFSYVYVIFEDGTDLYWARSRVLEYLSKVTPNLPQGVQTSIGPDATSVGWVYQYALIDESQSLNLAELRSIQDWQLKFHLQSLPGVAEVASVGGFVKQYQVNVDPNKLTAYNVTLLDLVKAIKQSNNDTGGRVLEFSGIEYMVRGRGYIKNIEDIEKTVVKTDPKTGVPVLVQHLGRVEIGPDMRRGVTDLNGWGDAPGGIIVMRQGENALNVIHSVKRKLDELAPSLPQGVKIIPVYDRSDLIERAIDSLKSKLTAEILIVCLVILVFLWHLPSAIVPIITIPVSILLAFIPLYFMGITTNIMSLSGIAISIGVLVDGAIVEVENAYKKLEQWIAGGRQGDFHEVRLNALKEVGPSVFFSLLVITVSFLPIFTLVDQEGRLFKPLAVSKTMTMALAALLALTLDPALRMMFSRMEPFRFKPRWASKVASQVAVGTYYPEEKHPISRVLFRIYEPVVHFVLKHAKLTLAGAALLMLLTIPVYMRLGSEFMPPLNEGAYLYMPTTLPGMSVAEAKRMLQKQDAIIKSFEEVATVYGKAGRADTSTDPAPFSMVETTIVLKPKEAWPTVERWYSALPGFLHPLFTWQQPQHRTFEELQNAMNEKLKFAGFPNIWTMPIKNRIDMLSTGIRTPVGIKVLGPDVTVIQKISEQIEAKIQTIPGTRTVYAERTSGGYYLDIVFNRDELARYGIAMEEAQMIVASAIGGENVSYTVQGLERYPINVRYAREFREDLEGIKRVLVPTPQGLPIPMAQLAEIKMVEGPAMIRNENGMRAGFVYVDIENRDVGGYVEEARNLIASQVSLPQGYSLSWSGQFENMLRVKERLKLVVPLTVFLIAMLLYMNTRSWIKTGIVMLAVPFSLIGAVWLLYFLDYNLSIAVWVGMIALMGLDAETGVFMLLYLDMAFEEKVKAGQMRTRQDLTDAIVYGAVKRIRPKMMTVMAAFFGLIPIMWSMGAGSDVMKRIAAPMVGGLVSSFALELLVYPVVYFIWKKKRLST